MRSLLLNGQKFYYDEIANYSFRNSVPLNGYETKTIEFCRNWLTGVQEFPVQTSGSTGVPKRTVLTRKQLEISARRTIKELNLQKDDCALVCLNTEFIAGMMMLTRGFIAEMDMVVVEPVANPLSLVPADKKIDFASFVPMQLQTILQEMPQASEILNSMKAILVGGAPISSSLEREIQLLKVPVCMTYGMTETASHIALRKLNGEDKAAYFNVLDNIEIGLDKRGCLTIKGDITNDELLYTNDIVELLTPTRFRWLGRVDNTINTGGVKVQSEKIEIAVAEAMTDLELPTRFFVASQPDELLGEKIVLVIEGEKPSEEAENELKERLRPLLKKFEMPKEFYYAKAFSETSTGKISKHKTLRKLGLEVR